MARSEWLPESLAERHQTHQRPGRPRAPGACTKQKCRARPGGNTASAFEVKAYREAGRTLGVELVERSLRTPADARRTFAQLRKADAQPILAPFAVTLNIPSFINGAAARLQLPTMFNDRFYGERGGLASYGVKIYEPGRQAARLLDKVIHGVQPGDIPIELIRAIGRHLGARCFCFTVCCAKGNRRGGVPLVTRTPAPPEDQA